MTDDRAPAAGSTVPPGDVRTTEERLAAQAAAGDRAAFEQLYRHLGDDVYRHVLFRVRDTSVAEDLTQEVFIKAFRAIGSLREPRRVRAWLLSIAHNEVIDHVKRQARRPEVTAEPEAKLWAVPSGPGSSPADRAEHALALDEVLRACQGLTLLQRQVIALRFISGLSVAETAAIMGRTANAIHNLQHHALAGLRRQLLSAVEGDTGS